MSRTKVIIQIICVMIIGWTISTAVYGDDSTMRLYVNGSMGALIIHSDMTSVVSGGNAGFLTGGENWNSESAGKQIVTLGDTEYASKTVTNNNIKNTMDTKQQLQFNDMAVVGSSYVMEDNRANIPDVQCEGGVASVDILGSNGTVISGQKPSYQSVEVQYSGIGIGGGKYIDGAVIDDSNITTSVRMESEHGGLGIEIWTDSEAGFNKSSNVMNFDQEMNTHIGMYDFNDSGFSGGIDLDWTDHSNPFKTIRNVTRLSKASNITNSS